MDPFLTLCCCLWSPSAVHTVTPGFAYELLLTMDLLASALSSLLSLSGVDRMANWRISGGRQSDWRLFLTEYQFFVSWDDTRTYPELLELTVSFFIFVGAWKHAKVNFDLKIPPPERKVNYFFSNIFFRLFTNTIYVIAIPYKIHLLFMHHNTP